MKILIVDTYYPDFLKSLPFNPAGTYQSELRAVLDQSFGTADFYSRNLEALGWEAIDIIANHEPLQNLWAAEHQSSGDTLAAQIQFYDPDVLFMQDLSVKLLLKPAILAGQCSCPFPAENGLYKYDVVFTSFPHYVERFGKIGVRAVYSPLAFDPIVLERADRKPERIHDCVFIGGVGAPSHWRYGMQVLNAVAEAIPTFKWWGYGADLLPSKSALREKYQGEAWGLEMYQILLRSKIVLNRHGEVAQGYANNMRMFEATGCGAILLTERAPNLDDFFSWDEILTYGSPDEAVSAIRGALDFWDERKQIAGKGQARTLRDHTYAQRMKTISDVLMGIECQAA